jgi:hypothetical protein
MALLTLLMVACSKTKSPINNPVNPTPPPVKDSTTNNKDSTTNINKIISGTCGQNLTWTLDTTTGILTISGIGAMDNYDDSPAPWNNFAQKIKQLQIGDSVTSIGFEAFSNSSYSNLDSITIGSGVTNIGYFAFSSCINLTSITIPNSVTYIEYGAFSFCFSLTSITIGNGVTQIGYYAFAGCYSLISITCLNPIPVPISSNVFFFSFDISNINFNGVNTDICILKIPSAFVALYQQAPGWSAFTNIVGM